MARKTTAKQPPARTPAQARAEAHEADTRVVTSVRMDPELLIAAKAMSVRHRMSVNEIIIDALTERLKAQGYITDGVS
jgi:hypothetical protein